MVLDEPPAISMSLLVKSIAKLAAVAGTVALVMVPVSRIELSAPSLTVKATLLFPTPEATTSNLRDPEATARLSKNKFESDKPLAVMVKVKTGSTVDSLVADGGTRANSGYTLYGLTSV